jgi:hypothetical protein
MDSQRAMKKIPPTVRGSPQRIDITPTLGTLLKAYLFKEWKAGL